MPEAGNGDHLGGDGESAAAQARSTLYPIYPLLLVAGMALVFSGNPATMIGGVVLVIGGLYGIIRIRRHRTLDKALVNTLSCPKCGRRIAASAPVCPRCETRL